MAKGDARREVGAVNDMTVRGKEVSKAAVASFVLAGLCLAVLGLSRIESVQSWFHTVDSSFDRLSRAPGWRWASTSTRTCIIFGLGLVVPLVAVGLAAQGFRDVCFRQARGKAWFIAGFLLAIFDLYLVFRVLVWTTLGDL